MYTYDDLRLGGSPSAVVVGLLGQPPYLGGDGIVACPVCKTYYHYTYTCGFGEHDVELQRISPTAAGSEPDIESFVRDLSHPNGDTREYAALSLVEYHLAHGSHAAVIDLLTHQDATVRIRAVVTVLYAEHDIRPYLRIFLDLLFDADASVRGNAGRVAHYFPDALKENRALVLSDLERHAKDTVLPPDAQVLVRFLEEK